MAIEQLTMPQLGESVTEGTIEKWLVNVGDYVEKYEPVAEIMTDKVTAEVPSSYSGTITEIIAKEGATIEVGETMCLIEVEQTEQDLAIAETKSEPKTELSKEQVDEDQSMKHRYSPAVLRLSQDHKINLHEVTGTGRGGRITRKDIELFIQRKDEDTKHVSATKPSQDILSTSQKVGTPTATGDIEIPVTGVRKLIAENMVRSKREIPHAWMTVEVDVTRSEEHT